MRFLLLLVAFAGMFGCGSGDGTDGTTIYHGTLITRGGDRVANARLTLFETSESATTDDQGQFVLESFKVLGEAHFFLESPAFSQTVAIDTIPEGTTSITFTLLYDPATRSLGAADIQFSSTPPVATPPAPVPGDGTPSPSPTSSGNFDENGNTTKFGIPSGLSGNIDRGRSTWNGTCSECHRREKSNRTYQDIQKAIRTQSQMRRLNLSDRTVADAVAYLNRGRR